MVDEDDTNVPALLVNVSVTTTDTPTCIAPLLSVPSKYTPEQLLYTCNTDVLVLAHVTMRERREGGALMAWLWVLPVIAMRPLRMNMATVTGVVRMENVLSSMAVLRREVRGEVPRTATMLSGATVMAPTPVAEEAVVWKASNTCAGCDPS